MELNSVAFEILGIPVTWLIVVAAGITFFGMGVGLFEDVKKSFVGPSEDELITLGKTALLSSVIIVFIVSSLICVTWLVKLVWTHIPV